MMPILQLSPREAVGSHSREGADRRVILNPDRCSGSSYESSDRADGKACPPGADSPAGSEQDMGTRKPGEWCFLSFCVYVLPPSTDSHPLSSICWATCNLLPDPAPSSLTLLGSPGIGGAALALAGANSPPVTVSAGPKVQREKGPPGSPPGVRTGGNPSSPEFQWETLSSFTCPSRQRLSPGL